jgi:hypothetical protein
VLLTIDDTPVRERRQGDEEAGEEEMMNDVLCPSFVGFLSDDISIPSIFQKSSFYLYDLSSNMKVLVFTHNDTTSHFSLRLFYDKV